MKKYAFEFETDTGYDIRIPNEIKNDNEKVQNLVYQSVQDIQSGDFYIVKINPPDILQNPDGSYYAHTRIIYEYQAVAYGETYEECEKNALAAYETADCGDLKFDEVTNQHIVNKYQVSADYEVINIIIEDIIERCRKSGEKGYDGHDRVIAVNMDDTGYDVDVVMYDAVQKLVSVSFYETGKLYESGRAKDPDVFPAFSNNQYEFGKEIVHMENIRLSTMKEMTESIADKKTNIKDINIDKETKEENLYNKLINIAVNESVLMFSSEDPNYYFKFTKSDTSDIVVTLYHEDKKYGETTPICLEDGKEVFGRIIRGEETSVQVYHNSPCEGKFTTTIQKSILQEKMETSIIKEWKDNFTIDISSDKSFSVSVDADRNEISVKRCNGRLHADGEDVIIGRKGHEPSKQDKTSDSIKELIDFMCNEFYYVRQNVHGQEETKPKKNNTNVKEKVIEID